MRPHFPGKTKRTALGAIAMVALAGLAGCGYSAKSLYPIDIHTVNVPIFGNSTYRRRWNFRLTEAIDKDIEEDTPYKVTGSRKADSVLTGTIVSIQENVLSSRFTTNLPQETQITVVVNFTWKDTRSGRILVARNNFSRASTEVLQLNQRVTNAEQAAVERAARGIVNQMQRPW